MRLKTCFAVCAAFIAAGFIFFAMVGGCGNMFPEPKIKPRIVYQNILPSDSNETDCPDCPHGLKILDAKAVETADQIWGLGLALEGGCAATAEISVGSVWLRQLNTNGHWERVVDWAIPLNEGWCYDDINVWTFGQPCVGEKWCSISDPWIEIQIEDKDNFMIQIFTQPIEGSF